MPSHKPWTENDPLPPELAERGKPLQSHPPITLGSLLEGTGAGRLADRLRGAFRGIDINRLMVWVGGVAFPLLAVAFVLTYFFVPITGGPPEIALGVAGVCLVLGLICWIYLLCTLGKAPAQVTRGEKTPPARPGKSRAARRAYLVYPDALVVLQGDRITVIRWDEVHELLYPAATGNDFRLVTLDGREVPLDRWVHGYEDLLMTVVARLNDILVPAALQAIAAGKRVTFGPFAVGRSGLRYKGKRVRWDDLDSMEIQSGRAGRRLVVRKSGSWFAWCWADLNRIPNNDVFYHVLCRTAPPRLLKPA